MLAKRIIPCLDVDKGRVVKGKKFKDIQDVADPVELAKRYNDAGADELVFYDITASNEERNIFLDVVEKVAREISIPFAVGGGIRSIDDIHSVLRSGAEKVSINSAAISNLELIREAAAKFGNQCIVLSIDAKETASGKWEVVINGGRKYTGIDAIEWAKKGEELGAGEIVVNAIDTDGEKDGYNLELTKAIADAVNIPIIASGGAGTLEHFSTVLKEANADAALAASVFHYGEIPIPKLKAYLDKENITVRR
ncbi:imidazole glycerol phosphate synthase subunit HisF [Oceanobacillus caeni]|uniref:imidazole glycerol phosphate synthase subunit HisF n=1 Tax=Bacillaceae TaxID=186817 RepID=UPI0006222D87|nr:MULTISPECIES: imidazole glycerol phosphate synthase subunit HisF [Bacillaceae]KKE79479.1 imidazole glycerol phosphate synthase [Bacilli bacterium VT-13-104]PZD83666.1 imidazole glycerol phosphate synthase subunit HisF [Bacilli bacterium]MCR1834850.1 imidazole glycerol phosphate synthase subunit HisF [Oceanobacillus caeni]MED4473266.1 imidazole glycerol phosphate synthase subunit HisF [Oceanobacillus caeni]PZD84806.1 imidazole glycerol phosphate synthase subunit HisF [Bacilli bacterium]